MSLCPAADYRASLSDAEFWEHVLLGGVQVEDNYYDGDDDPTADELHPVNEWGTCPVCGEIAACAVDINGDPMRHVATERTD